MIVMIYNSAARSDRSSSMYGKYVAEISIEGAQSGELFVAGPGEEVLHVQKASLGLVNLWCKAGDES